MHMRMQTQMDMLTCRAVPLPTATLPNCRRDLYMSLLANVVMQQCVGGGTTHDTRPLTAFYAHGIAPASTYSHIVDVVLNSLPCAQNVQAVAKSLALAPVPLYVVPHPVPCARFDYVVSTAVP